MNLPISAPPLRAYQQEDANWLVRLAQANAPALLAADTRLGKSRIALSAADTLSARRILIVAPATGRISWPIEIRKWATHRVPVLTVITPGKQLQTKTLLQRLAAPDAIVVMSYDPLSLRKAPWLTLLRQLPRWDILILDECQYLKSAGANRTRAVYGPYLHGGGLIDRADHVWLLSGTPTPNHAGELYSHYRALWPNAFSPVLNQHQFEDRFCRVREATFNNRTVRTIDGSNTQTLPILRRALGPYIRRRRRE